MKKFIFRLQKVMEYKEDIEKQKMGELAEAENRLMVEIEKLETLKKREQAYLDEIDVMRQQTVIHPVEIQALYRYIEKLKSMQNAQRVQINKAKKVVEAKRQALVLATQEKKVLEKLKEKQVQAYEAEVARQEQIFFDEIASTKYGRTKETSV